MTPGRLGVYVLAVTGLMMRFNLAEHERKAGT